MALAEDFKIRITAQGLENLDKISKGAENAKNKVDGLASAILGVSFGAFIAGALNAADGISDLSDATGISIVNLKAFQDALQSSGGKAKNVERAIIGFSQSIETAADGSDKMREAFGKVGVSLTDLKNLSEQDLLQKTIAGLDELKRSGASSSEVASTGAQLLTKAFRGVDVSKFFADFESGKITLGGVAEEIQKGADANAKLEESYKNLQLGALKAIQPIIDLMGEKTLTTEAATKIVTFLGVALALTFGAQMVARVIALNTAILGTAAAAALVGKNPVIKLIAGIGLTALGSAAAIEVYDQALKAVEETQKKAAEAAEAADKPGKPVRELALSAKQKAAIESEKRIQQSIADIVKSGRLATAREEAAIQINADSDIAKAREEIYNKEGLSNQQKLKEFTIKSIEIQRKADLDLAKFRREELLKTLQDEEKAREETGLAISKAYQEQEKAFSQASSIVNAYRQGNEELLTRYQLEQSIVDLSKLDQERAIKLFEIERDRAAKLRDIQALGLEPDARINREQALNKQIEDRIALINQEYDTRKAREQDYSAGVKEVMKRYEESFTPIKQGGMMAESVFNNMNSAIDNFVTTGKFKFGDFAASVVQDMIKIELKAMASTLLRGLLGSIFGGGTATMAGASVFGLPGYANGGVIPAGQPSIVGERGPELFIPKTTGTVIPNGSGGGSAMAMGGTTVNYNIQAVDASSFKALVARDPQFIYSVTEKGRRSQPNRRYA